MNPFPVQIRWESGQISPGNGVKVKLICLQDCWEVQVPWCSSICGEWSREEGMVFPRECVLHVCARAPLCVCVYFPVDIFRREGGI